MAMLNIRSFGFIVVIALSFIISGYCVQAEVCNGDVAKLSASCTNFVLKPGPQKDPSPECCEVIKNVDVPCVCNNIPNGIEAIVSMEKVVYVSKFCGKPLKSGSKCGDFTIPKA